MPGPIASSRDTRGRPGVPLGTCRGVASCPTVPLGGWDSGWSCQEEPVNPLGSPVPRPSTARRTGRRILPEGVIRPVVVVTPCPSTAPVSTFGVRCPAPSRRSVVPHRCGRADPRGTDPSIAAPDQPPPGGSRVTGAATHPSSRTNVPLADPAASGASTTSAVQHRDGLTVGLAASRSVTSPSRVRPRQHAPWRRLAVAGQARHLHLVAPVRGSGVSVRGSRSPFPTGRRNATPVTRPLSRGDGKFTVRSQDVHRSSPGCPQFLRCHAHGRGERTRCGRAVDDAPGPRGHRVVGSVALASCGPTTRST